MSQQRSPASGSETSVQSLLVLRKLTRAIGDTVRPQMMEHLATLTPLIRPKTVLGDYIQGGVKEPARKADKAFKELQALYETVASARPFNLPRELKPPLEIGTTNLEVTPVDYARVVQGAGEGRTITIRSPLTWVLTYGGFSPTHLKEQLDAKTRQTDDLQRFVLSYLVLHVVLANQPGVTDILKALHFPITTTTLPEFGSLPISRIGVAISTSPASDELMLQSAELTGVDAFEEVVNAAEIAGLRDPLRERLIEIVRAQAPELLPAGA